RRLANHRAGGVLHRLLRAVPARVGYTIKPEILARLALRDLLALLTRRAREFAGATLAGARTRIAALHAVLAGAAQRLPIRVLLFDLSITTVAAEVARLLNRLLAADTRELAIHAGIHARAADTHIHAARLADLLLRRARVRRSVNPVGRGPGLVDLAIAI